MGNDRPRKRIWREEGSVTTALLDCKPSGNPLMVNRALTMRAFRLAFTPRDVRSSPRAANSGALVGKRGQDADRCTIVPGVMPLLERLQRRFQHGAGLANPAR